MARIVFAWELGSGFGHVRYIAELARALKQGGHDVICVMKDVRSAQILLQGHDIRVLSAPSLVKPRRRLQETVSYAEVLINLGYLVSGQLGSVIRQWHDLFGVLDPDLLVVNHSPSALLSARGKAFSVAHFGTGFALPPDGAPIPPLVSWKKVAGDRVIKAERALMKALNKPVQASGGPPMASLSDLFSVDLEILATFSELDHYPHRTGGHYRGAILGNSGTVTPKWPHSRQGRRRIFCYLKPGHPDFSEVLGVLSRVDADKLVFLPGSADPIPDTSDFVVSHEPYELERACRESDLVVCHSGHGTISVALLQGTPLLMLPSRRHLEQTINARNVVKLGAGRAVKAEAGREAIERSLADVLESATIRDAARRFSRKYADFDWTAQVRQIVRDLERLALA